MEKFYLKKWSIGFEVPFFDQSNTEGYEELARDISSRYRDWFDVLDTGLTVVELPSRNKIILFGITIRVDSDLATKQTIESDWLKMKDQLTGDLENFMKIKKLDYKIIREL